MTNTGDRDGAEVVQVYTSLPGSTVARAPRELTGFAKVAPAAGEQRDVEADPVRIPLTIESTISEVMAHPVAGPIVGQALAAMAADLLGGGEPTGEDAADRPAETAGGLGSTPRA
ncbi:fibronectin type III-like domain-contianing protein [Agromyces sp. SYSU T00266]|uniref:fibronectin type III-like domain-contianing protein n=1 Tax=Agromyces zhanjiangensis TaxID=3158562 RepID=UPI003394EB52